MVKNKKVFFFFIVIFTALIYFLWLFKTYLGNHHSAYYSLWDYNLGYFNFENDYFIQNTNQFKISIIWPIFKVLKINFNNDIQGFIIHFAFSTINGLFVYKILEKNFLIKSVYEKIAILLSLLTIGTMLIGGNVSSWITGYNAVPTYFTYTLMIVFVYCFLNFKNQILLFILSSLLILSQLRVAWFPIGICCFYSIFLEKDKSKLFWILGVIISLLYLFQLTDQISSKEEKIIIFKNVLAHSRFEADFNLQKYYKQIFLIISFIINFYILKFFKKKNILKNEFIMFLQTVLFISIFVYSFAKFYTYKGYLIYPFPELLAISFTRALGLYQLFFWILLAKYISILKCNIHLKYIFFIGIFYVPSTFWRNLDLEPKYFIGLFIFSIILLTYFLLNNFFKKKYFQKEILALLIFLILLLPGVSYLTFQNLKKFNFYSFGILSKWTLPQFINEDEKLLSLVKLRQCDDFILYDYQKLWISSAVAGKSQYVGHRGYNHFNLELAKVHLNRKKIHEDLMDNIINKTQINNSIIKDLKKDNVFVLTNKKDIKIFEKIEKFQISKNYFIVFFSDNQYKINNFKKSCQIR